MHIVIINLKQPGVTIKTTGPNGDRQGETDLEMTLAFVQRNNLAIIMGFK